jgi:hypothetical protein
MPSPMTQPSVGPFNSVPIVLISSDVNRCQRSSSIEKSPGVMNVYAIGSNHLGEKFARV